MNDLQHNIMSFIDAWVRREKKPVPRTVIYSEMGEKGVKKHVITTAIDGLIRKGYISRSQLFSKYTSYVQLRSI